MFEFDGVEIKELNQDNFRDLNNILQTNPITFKGDWIPNNVVEFPVNTTQNFMLKYHKKGIIAFIKRLFKNKSGWAEIPLKCKIIGYEEIPTNKDGTTVKATFEVVE
jgi:hypothetical protein